MAWLNYSRRSFHVLLLCFDGWDMCIAAGSDVGSGEMLIHQVLVQSCQCPCDGRLKEFLMRSRSENSCANVWSSCGSARQVSSLELLFPNLLYKLNAADGCRHCLESLEPEHRRIRCLIRR